MFDPGPDHADRARHPLFLPELRIPVIEFPHLAISSPTDVAVPSIPKIERGNLVEPTRQVERRRALIGCRLVVKERVGAGRSDGLLIETLGIEFTALQACDLRADKSGAAQKIFRAVLGPRLELTVVDDQAFFI